MRWLSLVVALSVVPVWAGDFELRTGRTQSLLTRNAQDRQFVRDQAQLAQTLMRVEESQRLIAQSRIPLLTSPRFELVRPEERANLERASKYAEELDQHASRLRQLEAERRKAWSQLLSTRQVQRIVVD